MTHPLYVAFVWHQHQPDYRDPCGGPAYLPWARLHAAKDYCHMAELVADYPAIHCTFNFVPSLVDQLAGIGEGRYVDAWQVLSLEESWTPEDKQFLLDHFFSIHPRLLERYPAYVRLRDRRHEANLPDSYFLDLAAWFNLAWIDPRTIARDETLCALVDKGQSYTHSDIATILAKQRELAARVIPVHRDLAQRGQIELSVSPYYHPILPLLIDQQSARQALPHVSLPAASFVHPEDAAEQIRRAVNAHRRYFGLEPHGMWPSEGAVSDALVGILGNEFRWLASDEEILARSLRTALPRDAEGTVTQPRVLYQPYRITRTRDKRNAPLASAALVFRDHVLSDRIGFAYQYMSAHDAVGELIYRLHRIQERIADPEHAYLVSIILDGENAWESYEDNGDPFFRELYGALSQDPSLRTVTLGEYLHANPPRANLAKLAAGSWINGNFDTWIGEPAQNLAWERLSETRQSLVQWQRDFALADESALSRAWDELYIAEGSDWFWWYSSHNNSAQNAMFDRLFREHLQNVYTTIGLPAPNEMKAPIGEASGREHARGVSTPISPPLVANENAGDEWNGAGMIEAESSLGTMQRAANGISRLFFGYNTDELFFRVEGRVDLAPYRVALYISLPDAERNNTRPRGTDTDAWLALTFEIAVEPGQTTAQIFRADGQEVWEPAGFGARAAVRGRVIELALSRQDLGVQPNDTIGEIIALTQEPDLVELFPPEGVQPWTLKETT